MAHCDGLRLKDGGLRLFQKFLAEYDAAFFHTCDLAVKNIHRYGQENNLLLLLFFKFQESLCDFMTTEESSCNAFPTQCFLG